MVEKKTDKRKKRNHFNRHCICCGISFTDNEAIKPGSKIFQKDDIFIKQTCLHNILKGHKIEKIPVSIDDAIILLLQRAQNLISCGLNKKNQEKLKSIFQSLKIFLQEPVQTLGQFFKKMLIKVDIPIKEAKEILLDIYLELSTNKEVCANNLFAQPL